MEERKIRAKTKTEKLDSILQAGERILKIQPRRRKQKEKKNKLKERVEQHKLNVSKKI